VLALPSVSMGMQLGGSCLLGVAAAKEPIFLIGQLGLSQPQSF